MAKKEANSFVLTIAGIAAATVIGVVGVKLTPAPHVIFSLAPSAEPQATAEPEPIGCVLAGTGQVVDFADPGAEEYVSLLDTDSQSLTERYALPALERMTQSDTESLIAPLQVIQRRKLPPVACNQLALHKVSSPHRLNSCTFNENTIIQPTRWIQSTLPIRFYTGTARFVPL